MKTISSPLICTWNQHTHVIHLTRMSFSVAFATTASVSTRLSLPFKVFSALPSLQTPIRLQTLKSNGKMILLPHPRSKFTTKGCSFWCSNITSRHFSIPSYPKKAVQVILWNYRLIYEVCLITCRYIFIFLVMCMYDIN